MADQFENFRAFLPKYLSPDAQKNLFSELSQFPPNIDKRLYSDRLRRQPYIYQGDGLTDLPVTNLPEERIARAHVVLVVSNSCDVDVRNRRFLGARLMYCPIITMEKYSEAIRTAGNAVSSDHLDHVRKQRLSSLFFLPKYGNLEDSVGLLDRIVNHDLSKLDVGAITQSRMFVLSDYGFYYFLFKLSIHLTRMQEGTGRS